MILHQIFMFSNKVNGIYWMLYNSPFWANCRVAMLFEKLFFIWKSAHNFAKFTCLRVFELLYINFRHLPENTYWAPNPSHFTKLKKNCNYFLLCLILTGPQPCGAYLYIRCLTSCVAIIHPCLTWSKQTKKTKQRTTQPPHNLF